MSPQLLQAQQHAPSFPRACGDEPPGGDMPTGGESFPRACGDEPLEGV